MALYPSEMFKVLGVETRVRVVELLKSKGPLGVKNMAEVLGITPAAVSQHLKVLRHVGLVRNERRGYCIPYWIDEEALENCRRMLDEVCTCGCRGKGRVKRQEPRRVGLVSLMKYEEELQKKLEDVRERISEIRGQGE